MELFVERDMNKMRSVLKLVFYTRNKTRILFDMTLQKHIVNFVHCANSQKSASESKQLIPPNKFLHFHVHVINIQPIKVAGFEGVSFEMYLHIVQYYKVCRQQQISHG